MQKIFGEDGFGLYRLPEGQLIRPEEFSEFNDAYRAFADTQKFHEDVKAIKNATKPIVFIEGKTDIEYLKKAAELIGQKELLQGVELRDGGGFPNLDKIQKGKSTLDKIWKSITPQLSEIIPQEIILLYDCDKPKPNNDDKGNVFKRHIPLHKDHPLKKGIENLFEKKTLEKARKFKPEIIDITSKHKKIERGETKDIPAKWIVNKDEKPTFATTFVKTAQETTLSIFK